MQSTTSSTRTFQTSPTKEEPKKPRRQLKLPKSKLRFSYVLIVILLVVSLFLYMQYRDAKHKLQATNNPAVNTQQVSSLVSHVGKLIILPQGETPTLVTVNDASKLKGQAFYANARNGDVTLVYSKAQKAILYRPSQNIIVNVAAVTVSSASNGQ